MRIGQCLNTTRDEVGAKISNIFYGFSLGNKYFTPEHIRSYLEWALENTKDKIAVLIPDKIHAINYEVKNGYSPRRAMSVALRKGGEIENIVRKIVEDLNIPKEKIQIVRWQDIEDESYIKMLSVISTAFEQNSRFRKTVIQMTKDTPHLNSLDLLDSQYEKLAQYIINELPVLISGFDIGNTHYGMLPYPGFAKLDYLAIDLQEGISFPEITAQLNIKNKLKLIELYAD